MGAILNKHSQSFTSNSQWYCSTASINSSGEPSPSNQKYVKYNILYVLYDLLDAHMQLLFFFFFFFISS
jgi:hypothetical protein